MIGTYESRQVWSNMSRGFLNLYTSPNPVINASSLDESPSLKWYKAQISPEVVPWYLVFSTTKSSTEYALAVNSNDVIATRFTAEMKSAPRDYQHCLFIPDHFGYKSGSPFQCLRLMKNTKQCVAADQHGTLRVRTLDKAYPHPETMFVISRQEE